MALMKHFFKAFRAYYELKIADGKENLLTLKDEDFLSKYREEIFKKPHSKF